MTDYGQASVEDLPAVLALLKSCSLPTQDITPAMLGGFLVARHDGQVVGVAAVVPAGTDALLRSVAVAPDHRGLGIAERLCDLLEKRARQAGIANLYLLTQTAEGYFAQRGFRSIERAQAPAPLQATAEFQQLCPASAVCMRKALRVPRAERRRGGAAGVDSA
ncbi:MAG TPA: arsenic resistance N-acetyltransferase ArsN2 [Burkholderiales bacterium]|nr:arsenic resistance N-acetyltransferase ArsN2 [Burkholderiales bacterium]